MLKTIFRTALTDVDTVPKEELGCLRHENDGKFGDRLFKYVQNRTGGTLAKDSLVMYDGVFIGTPVACTTNTLLDTIIRAAGSWITAGAKVDDIVAVVDDAGAAGAAPEGETSFITSVTELTLKVSPPFTAAVTITDTVEIIKRWAVLAAAAAADVRTAGIPMADLLTLTYGWVQCRGIYLSANVTAAGTAITEGMRLKAGTAILEAMPAIAINAADATDAYLQPVATALQTLAADTVRRKCVVLLDCLL